MRARLVRWASLVMCCAVAAVCFAALAEDIISLPITLEEGYQDVPRPAMEVTLASDQGVQGLAQGDRITLHATLRNGHTQPLDNVVVFVQYPSALTLMNENGQAVYPETSSTLNGQEVHAAFHEDASGPLRVTASWTVPQAAPMGEIQFPLVFQVADTGEEEADQFAAVAIWTDHGGEAEQQIRLAPSLVIRGVGEFWLHGLGEGNAPIATTFQLTALSDNSVVTAASDGAHVVHFQGLPTPGIYTLEETSAASGYGLLPEKWTISFAPDGTITAGLQQGDQPLMPAGAAGHFQLLHRQTYTRVAMPAAGGYGERLVFWLGVGCFTMGLWMVFRQKVLHPARKEGGQ